MSLSIVELAPLLRQQSISPVEVVRECLARIERLDPRLNAFITVMSDLALSQARKAESEIREGNWRGPLHGVPVGIKDLIDTADAPTTAASLLFKARQPKDDAEVVRRLRAAGAVLIGKQNLHEFAYGGSSIVSCFGEVHNPWNLAHIAGGSSGGSAAAVAAGLGLAAIGTDTAGSVREPAAQCAVVGLKPTYGRVSVRGVIPLAPSFDHVGPICRCVADAAVVLQAIAEPDSEKSRTVPDYVSLLRRDPKPLRIGVPRKFFYEHLHPEVSAAMEQALKVLSGIVREVREIEIEVPTGRSLQSFESYAYHAGFVERSAELYQPETLRRIKTGASVTPEEAGALRLRLAQLRREIVQTFGEVDLLVTPTTPVPAPTVAELKQEPDRLREHELLLLRNTRPFNVWGIPAISVPCGFTPSGLPVGLQISASPWEEGRVLQLAHAYEQATDWHKREPPLG